MPKEWATGSALVNNLCIVQTDDSALRLFDLQYPKQHWLTTPLQSCGFPPLSPPATWLRTFPLAEVTSL
jgi:hypothetical protein